MNIYFLLLEKLMNLAGGDYLSGEDGELEGILPKKIETRLNLLTSLAIVTANGVKIWCKFGNWTDYHN